jgi:hypothetical protein
MRNLIPPFALAGAALLSAALFPVHEATALRASFRATIQTAHGDYICPADGGWGIGQSPRPDYSSQPCAWDFIGSPHADGYFIRSERGGYWQDDRKDTRLRLWGGGADNWETYILEDHPMGGGQAIKSYESGRYVAAEPPTHGVHLIANRDAAREWERFTIARISLPAATPAQPQAVCGLVVFDHTQGTDSVYKGVKFGSIDVVTHEETNVVTRGTLNVVPGGMIELHADQGFVCP